MNSVIITKTWINSEQDRSNVSYIVDMKELNLQFMIDSFLTAKAQSSIFVLNDDNTASEPYVMWRGVTTMEALRFLEDTHLEMIGFMHDQAIFANKMWDDIQNADDWTHIPGVVDAPEGSAFNDWSADLDDWTAQTTKAQMDYIKEEMIKKFGQFAIFDYDSVQGGN